MELSEIGGGNETVSSTASSSSTKLNSRLSAEALTDSNHLSSLFSLQSKLPSLIDPEILNHNFPPELASLLPIFFDFKFSLKKSPGAPAEISN